MLMENEFTVAAPIDFLWNYLLDVEKIAPCMPGAELTEVVDDKNWKGKLNAKFGPVSMSFAGTVTIESRDDAAHRVVLSAKGMEQKGKGAANAKVTSWLEPGPSDGVTTGEDGGRHHAHRGGRAALPRAAPRDLEEAHADVRRLPAGVDGRGADHARRDGRSGGGDRGRGGGARQAAGGRQAGRRDRARASRRSGPSSPTSSASSSG